MSDTNSEWYATMEELKYALELTNTAHLDGDIPRALEAAGQGIDEACGRTFVLDGDSTHVRWYSPTNPRTIEIDDLAVVTSVMTDVDGNGTFETTWTRNTDYVLEPLNSVEDGRPFERLRVHSRGGKGWWPCWERSVQVTGQFGWPRVPKSVNQACLIIATKLIRRMRDAPFGVVTIGLDGAAVHIARNDPDVTFLLAAYTRTYPFA